MPERRKLEDRRPHHTSVLSFTNGSGKTFKFIMSVSMFDDGSVAEAFLETHKASTDTQALASDAAIVFSIARQYGTPLQVLMDGMSRNSDGTPQSILGALIDHACEEEKRIAEEQRA